MLSLSFLLSWFGVVIAAAVAVKRYFSDSCSWSFPNCRFLLLSLVMIVVLKIVAVLLSVSKTVMLSLLLFVVLLLLLLLW